MFHFTWPRRRRITNVTDGPSRSPKVALGIHLCQSSALVSLALIHLGRPRLLAREPATTSIFCAHSTRGNLRGAVAASDSRTYTSLSRRASPQPASVTDLCPAKRSVSTGRGTSTTRHPTAERSRGRALCSLLSMSASELRPTYLNSARFSCRVSF